MSESRIFLCHSSFDKPSVRQLYRRLSADGFEPWLDEEDLLPGQDWELEITSAIKQSRAVIVCLSQESTQKTGFVQREIRFALDAADERPEGSIFIIPARLERCPTPQRLMKWHWVDLYKDNGYSRLRSALAIALPRTREENAAERHSRAVDPDPARSGHDVVSWQDTEVRYDGLYMRPNESYTQYLRFRSSGICHAASSTGTPEQVSMWLGSATEALRSKGPFTILGDQIKIVNKSSSGTVEFRGTVGPLANELHLYTHSYINGYESFGVWRFHPLQFPDVEED
ncbi:toll/interleukin-1 receptor domain-containing protein [Dactylosporangium sp. NPDC049525]|uniref:toll/interleukin-1 receptor domain-containing protein n=1 Tax=Dactylosporangium sp. NPDC049525 TaxID=3154730 RepID=UPI003421101D